MHVCTIPECLHAKADCIGERVALTLLLWESDDLPPGYEVRRFVGWLAQNSDENLHFWWGFWIENSVHVQILMLICADQPASVAESAHHDQ